MCFFLIGSYTHLYPCPINRSSLYYDVVIYIFFTNSVYLVPFRTSTSYCRASETLNDFLCELTFSSYMPVIYVMQGQYQFKDISRCEYFIYLINK